MAVLHRGAPIHARTCDTADTWSALQIWAATYECVHVDIGTGDGRYALRLAQHHPGTAVIGLDTNLDRLRGARKRRPGNLRFVKADALSWPVGALPRADLITINFPYGSLLRALVDAGPDLIDRLDALLAPRGRIEVRVNASALVSEGLNPELAPAMTASTLRRIESTRLTTEALGQAELRSFPSTWAKRLSYGRETSAWLMVGGR